MINDLLKDLEDLAAYWELTDGHTSSRSSVLLGLVSIYKPAS